MRTKNSLWIVLVLVSLCFSCEKAPVYEKAYTFQDNKWEQNVKPTFAVEVKDTTKEYDFVLTLRATTDYKYSNLWVYMNTKTPDGQKAREPFEIHITHPDGSWVGKKTGTIVENVLSFKRRKLPKPGKYIFILEQGITESQINELLDISFRVDEAK